MDRQTEEIQQSKETAMHSPRVAPCVPLCGLLQEGVASVYPCGCFSGCWANVGEVRKV